MYALRERRVHVTQEDFEMAVTKVQSIFLCNLTISMHYFIVGVNIGSSIQ